MTDGCDPEFAVRKLFLRDASLRVLLHRAGRVHVGDRVLLDKNSVSTGSPSHRLTRELLPLVEWVQENELYLVDRVIHTPTSIFYDISTPRGVVHHVPYTYFVMAYTFAAPASV